MAPGGSLKPSRIGWHGERLARLQLEKLKLSEIYYPSNARTRPHSHDRPFFFMVKHGSLTERYQATDHQYKQSTMFYMQSDETHAEHFHSQGAHCFVIELSSSWLKDISYTQDWVDNGSRQERQPFADSPGPHHV